MTEKAPMRGMMSSRATLVLLSTLVVAHKASWALLPFVLAALLAYVCNPIVEHVSARFRASRSAAASVVFISILAIVAAGAYFGVPALVRELEYLLTHSQSILLNLTHSLLDDQTVVIIGKSMGAEQIAEAAMRGLREPLGSTERIAYFATIGLACAFGVVLVLVLLFFLLAQGPEIVQGALWLAPLDKRLEIQLVLAQLEPLLWRYFLGVLVVVVLATVAAYIGLSFVLGLRHALFLALLTGVLEMIPVLGPAASALIGGLVALQNAAGVEAMLVYTLYVTFLRLLIDQLVAPIVLGKAASLSSVVIIFCFLIGGALFGVPGVILAAPAALTVKTSIAVLRDYEMAR